MNHLAKFWNGYWSFWHWQFRCIHLSMMAVETFLYGCAATAALTIFKACGSLPQEIDFMSRPGPKL